MKNKKLSLKQNMLYNSIGSFVYLGCQWLLTILVVKFSGYDDAGIVSLAMSISSALYAISAYNMRGYQSSDIKNDYSSDDYVFSRIITCFIGVFVCFLFVLFNHYSFYTKCCIFIYMIFKTSEALVDVLNGEEQKEWRMDVCGISMLLRGIVSIICFSLTLYLSKNLLLSIMLMSLSTYIVIYFYDLNKYKNIIGFQKKFCFINVRRLLIICFPLALYAFIGNSILFFPKYFLELNYSKELLGIYSSLATPVMIIQVAASFIFNPLITLISEFYIKKDSRQFYGVFFKVLLFIIFIGVLGYIFIYFFGSFGLSLLFNDEILSYKNLLYPILIVTLLTSFIWFVSMLLTVIRSFKILVLGSITSLLSSIIMSLIIIPHKGLNGVNDVLIISNIVELFIWLIFGGIAVNCYFKGGSMGKKFKKIILDFAIAHRTIIMKIVPNKVINFFEKKIVGSGLNDFERTTIINRDLPNGVNCVGSFTKQSGLGQTARSMFNNIEKTKYDVCPINYVLDSNEKNDDCELSDIFTNDFKYNINLFVVQPHTSFESMISKVSLENLKGRYNIAYWLYELEDIPDKWLDTYKYVNEIWTPTDFVSDAFRKPNIVPVYTVPFGMEVKSSNRTKDYFGIPEDKFTYLMLYDPKSSIERKNPDAAIDAFIKAFPDNNDVCLVIKINSAEQKHIASLEKRLETVKHYKIINDVLPKEDVYALISLCDVYVSLHRSEGLGLVMAEAMTLGTVCIATNYSGNLQFMNSKNSCLVDYKKVKTGIKDHYAYREFDEWAEPDINQASQYMIDLYNDKKAYEKLKKQAQKDVCEFFSYESCGRIIENRINEILKENNL